MGKSRIKEGGFLIDDICGVYLIVSPSGRRYVGSSINIRERWSCYRRLEQAPNSVSLIISSIKKYGYSNHVFKILHKCNPKDRLIWERIFGDLYLVLNDFGGLNMNLPGYDEIPKIISKESRDKMSKTRRIEDREEAERRRKENLIKNKKKWRERNKKPFRKHIKTEKQINTSRAVGNERAKDPAFSEMMRAEQIKYFSIPENRIKAAERTRQQFKDPKQIEIARIRGNRIFGNPETHPHSKKVIDINTGQIFSCAKLAALSIGMASFSLRSRLNGNVPNNTTLKYLTA